MPTTFCSKFKQFYNILKNSSFSCIYQLIIDIYIKIDNIDSIYGLGRLLAQGTVFVLLYKGILMFHVKHFFI